MLTKVKNKNYRYSNLWIVQGNLDILEIEPNLCISPPKQIVKWERTNYNSFGLNIINARTVDQWNRYYALVNRTFRNLVVIA